MTQPYTDPQIAQMIKEFITKELLYDKPEVVLENDSPLIEPGYLDSIGIFRLITFIEEQFEVSVKSEEILVDNFKTVDIIKSFVLTKL